MKRPRFRVIVNGVNRNMDLLNRGASNVPTEGPTLGKRSIPVCARVTCPNTPRPLDEGSKMQTLLQLATASRASPKEQRLHCCAYNRVGIISIVVLYMSSAISKHPGSPLLKTGPTRTNVSICFDLRQPSGRKQPPLPVNMMAAPPRPTERSHVLPATKHYLESSAESVISHTGLPRCPNGYRELYEQRTIG